jgi:hypothetical protein
MEEGLGDLVGREDPEDGSLEGCRRSGGIQEAVLEEAVVKVMPVVF